MNQRMNKHAENIKNAVNDYKKATEAAKQKIDYITATYGPTAGEAERELQLEKLKKAKTAATDTITKAGDAGYREVEAWERMDGSKMNTDDMRLLDAGLIDHGEFDRLKVKYRDNSTMLAALRKYGERQNNENHREDFIPFNLRDIPTAEGKRKQWKNAQTQALDMLDAMDGTGKYEKVEDDDLGTAFSLGLMEEQMKTFGEDL
jgi:hypothetical protein